MGELVQLVGLDFGTTTSSALVATAQLTRNAVTGRTELDQVRELFRSDLEFTPLNGELLDEPRIEQLLDHWLSVAGVVPVDVFGGGALLTGLTARRSNADGLVRLIRKRLQNALIATADDPCLESWLAFMGSCGPLSQTHPDRSLINIDIGGGTTNIALGRAGHVCRTGCLFVGARHIQVEPGTYRVTRLSPEAVSLLAHLGINKGCGASLSPAEIEAITGFYVQMLEAAATGDLAFLEQPAARLLVQIPFELQRQTRDAALLYSGGVGELIYRQVQGVPPPPMTCYGDLGIELASRILQSTVLARDVTRFTPAAAGRATVCGLLRHATEISGSTLFLPDHDLLPLADLPILGNLSDTSTEDDLSATLQLVRRSVIGGGLRVELSSWNAAAVAAFGQRLCRLLEESGFPATLPLVLFLRANAGKTLGNYITGWGARPRNLVVIDEVDVPDAQFARIGTPRHLVVPVAFYGLHPSGAEA